MTDKAEHRVAMFQLGRERRAQGKQRWAKTVDIKAFIHDQYSDDVAVNAYHVVRNVSDLIKDKCAVFLDMSPTNDLYDRELDEVIEEMQERTVEGLREDEEMDDNVRYYLSEIYDFMDRNSIWAGDGTKIVKMLDWEAAVAQPANGL